jgi:hypothetical protein
MTDKEVMQMALDALIPAVDGKVYTSWAGYGWAAIEALRAALAQPEQAECDGGQCGIGGYCKQCPKTQPEPDYEAEFIKDWNEGKVKRVSDGKRMVPQREWVGLTRDQVSEIWVNGCYEFDPMHAVQTFARAIEAKLKDKNSG